MKLVFIYIHNDFSEGQWTFIIHFMNSWAEAPLLEVVKDFSVHTDVFGSGSVFHWADNYAIRVINVTHNDVIVAPAGNGRETFSEISSKESSGFYNIQVGCF